MKLKKSLIVSLSILSCLSAASLSAQPTVAQSTLSQSTLAEPTTPTSEPTSVQPSPFATDAIQFTPPVLTDRRRPRGRARGGASRGSCAIAAGQPPLTAIIPTTLPDSPPTESLAKKERESVFSLTTKANPTLWFYVPYDLQSTRLELVLQDENNNTLHRGDVSASNNTSGIVQVTLPEASTALQPDELYHWYLLAYCDESSPAFVEGWIERTTLSPDLTATVSNATPLEQAALYAENGIWQEAITLVGELYLKDTADAALSNHWNSLLESASLTDLIQ